VRPPDGGRAGLGELMEPSASAPGEEHTVTIGYRDHRPSQQHADTNRPLHLITIIMLFIYVAHFKIQCNLKVL